MTNHILVIEDDTELRKAIAYGLQSAGYQVSQAANGEIALAMLAQTDAAISYDLIITDIVMGDIDGTMVLKEARNRPEAPEVVMLTGYGSLETAMDAIKAGAFDYLLKPCRMTYLLERVNAALEQRAERLNKEHAAAAWYKMSNIFTQIQEQSSTTLPSFPLPETPAPQQETPATTDSPDESQRYLDVGALRIDTYRHEVWFNAQPVHATLTEYTILTCLAATPERVVSFDEIADQIHEDNFDHNRTRPLLAWHIGNLRKKLDRRYLVSVRGVGYMLNVPGGVVKTDEET